MPRITDITDPQMFGGMWKFSDQVSRNDVVNIAKSLRARRDADYFEIYVRAYQGDDQFAVCFRAIGDQRKYVLKVLDLLERDLGKGKVVFDISAPITVII